MSGEIFVGRLLQVLPELKAVHDRHIADNDSLLPHVFMGDVTRFIIAEVGRSGMHETLKRLLFFFEKELSSGEPEAKELILASFVENLIGETATVEKLVPLMGTNLRREVKAIIGY
jgi:hypothetical protein